MSPHLKTLRKRVGLSIEEVAARAGEPAGTIFQIEDCNIIPSDELKERIARAIGFPVEVIWPATKPSDRIPAPLHSV
jgi:transcriptional regulator with XRE-family HTH domain